MRPIAIFALVLMQFTVLPFFSMLASAREKPAIIQSGMSVVYKTTDEWPGWLTKNGSVKL